MISDNLRNSGIDSDLTMNLNQFSRMSTLDSESIRQRSSSGTLPSFSSSIRIKLASPLAKPEVSPLENPILNSESRIFFNSSSSLNSKIDMAMTSALCAVKKSARIPFWIHSVTAFSTASSMCCVDFKRFPPARSRKSNCPTIEQSI